MSTNSKSLSVSFIGLRYGVTEKTARFFMLKLRESMSSSGNTTLDGFMHVDVFVLGGIAQGKVGRSYNNKKKKSVQLTKDGKNKISDIVYYVIP
jgi:hypothetical protein